MKKLREQLLLTFYHLLHTPITDGKRQKCPVGCKNTLSENSF